MGTKNKTRLPIVSLGTETFTFGKYKGQSVDEVMMENAGYILWLQGKNIIHFSQPILDKAEVERGFQTWGREMEDNYAGYGDNF